MPSRLFIHVSWPLAALKGDSLKTPHSRTGLLVRHRVLACLLEMRQDVVAIWVLQRDLAV